MKKLSLLVTGILIVCSSCRPKTYSCYCTKTNGETETEGIYDKKNTKDAEANCATKSNENRTCKAVFAG